MALAKHQTAEWLACLSGSVRLQQRLTRDVGLAIVIGFRIMQLRLQRVRDMRLEPVRPVDLLDLKTFRVTNSVLVAVVMNLRFPGAISSLPACGVRPVRRLRRMADDTGKFVPLASQLCELAFELDFLRLTALHPGHRVANRQHAPADGIDNRMDLPGTEVPAFQRDAALHTNRAQ